MSLQPFAVAPILGLLAATPVAGFALQNGTPNILTWTAPADGQMHRVLVHAGLRVTSAETGGAVTLTVIQPDGSTYAPGAFAGGSGTNATSGFTAMHPVQAGSTVTLAQSSALTAGAAVVWAELWGS